MKKSSLFLLLILSAGVVQAQTAGTVTLRANATSATGSMAPVLTWSTSPTASSCVASGGWSGSKSASGTQTLPTISASTNYTLTCSWGSGYARVGWIAPTTNTNGSPITNLAGYRVYYGTSTGSLTRVQEVSDVGASFVTVSPLATGTWYFKVKAVNANRTESADSNIASKVVSTASSARTVGITINPAPARRTIATTVYDVVRNSAGKWSLGRSVGTVPIGTPCRTYYLTGDWYGVQTGYVSITRTPRTNTLVAHCGAAN